jgi:hypothetical protein
MTTLVRNIIFLATAVAFVTGTVRAVAALPVAMHDVGIVSVHTWEELIVESLEATGL